MADFRVLDVVSRLFPEVTEAVEAYKKVRSDSEIRGIARSLANEEALFTQFARKVSLLSQSSTHVGSLDKSSLDTLGAGTTDFILKGLNEMEDLLHKLKSDLNNFSVSAAVLKEIKSRSTSPQTSRKTAQKTPFMIRLEKLSEVNTGLIGRLLDSRMPLPLPDETHSVLTASSLFHRDRVKPEKAWGVINAARGPEVDAAILRCRCGRCNPRYEKPESRDDEWNLEAFLLLKPADKGNGGQAEPPILISESSSVALLPPAPQQSTNQHTSPRIKWVPLSLNNLDGGDDKPLQSENSNKVFLSLGDLMGHRNSLDHHQRMELSFRLSSAVLHLSSTPWVTDSWTLDDWFIALLGERENETHSLFIRRRFSPPRDSAKKDPSWSIIAREPLLIRLGIHLTELALGRSLADLRREEPGILRAEDLKIEDIDLLDLITIRRLLTLRTIAQRASPDFQDVVSACINQQYRDRRHSKIQDLDTSDPAFLSHATTAILVPLYHEVHKYYGPNPVKARKGGSSRAERHENQYHLQRRKNMDQGAGHLLFRSLKGQLLSTVLVPTRSDDTSEMPSRDTPQSDSTEGQLVDDASQSTPERPERRTRAPRDESDAASDYSYGTYTESTHSAFAKLRPDHPFLRFREPALQFILAQFQMWKAAGNSTGTSGQSAPGISQGYDDDDDDDNDDTSHSPNFSRKKQRGEKEVPTFACPFLKKDPVAHKQCCMFVLSRIRDVKQHLRRRHQMPIYCPRCVKIFENEDDRDDHILESNCIRQPGKPGKPDGITERQKKALSEKAPASQPPEAQWFGIYKILFPDQEVMPQSPYMDMDSAIFRSSVMYQEFVLDQGPQLIGDLLTARGALAWNLQHEERDRTQFLHQILHDGLRNLFDRYLREGHGGAVSLGAAAINATTSPSYAAAHERAQESEGLSHRADRESTVDAASISGHFTGMNLDVISEHSHSLNSFNTYSTTTERSDNYMLGMNNLLQDVIDEGYAHIVVSGHQSEGYPWMGQGH
ncbi:hypothetical protein B0T16DRAFT_395178 [Cercophora newfieldiana]|uniref:DUF7580 domain-containing protein n=1 Tax=Cercophora newfieldiana TaxID=92897 RepID=A0AA39XTM7_9PEZI|nr:hypothetical protein B0T16DRAFT_395178 [Cercophora newfieldiana]